MQMTRKEFAETVTNYIGYAEQLEKSYDDLKEVMRYVLSQMIDKKPSKEQHGLFFENVNQYLVFESNDVVDCRRSVHIQAILLEVGINFERVDGANLENQIRSAH